MKGWIVAALSSTLVMASPGHGLSQQNQEREDGKRQTQEDRSPNTVIDTSGLRWLLDEAIKAYRSENAANAQYEHQKEDREREDLAAQKDMALWAFWMFAAATAQLVVGLITLTFLWLTFREARRTADAGIEAARAASRAARASVAIELPILTVTHPPFLSDTAVPRASWEGAPTIERLAAGQHRVISALFVSNHGRTPALITRVSTGYWARAKRLPEEPTFVASHHFTAVHVLAEGIEHRPIGIPGVVDIDDPLIDEINAERASLYLFVMIEFEDFMRTIRRAGFCFRWTKGARDEFSFVPATDAPEKYTPKPQDG